MVPVAQQQIVSLQTAGTEQLKQLREEAKREADAASGLLRGEISTIKTELDGTGERVTDLSNDVQKMGPTARQQIEGLQSAEAEQLKQFREDAKHEAAAASGSLRSEISSVETEVRQDLAGLQSAETEQLQKFHEDAKQEADAASTDFRTEFSKEVRTRSLKIVNASGQTLVSLSAASAGGEVEMFGTTSGKRIAFVGATDSGDTVLGLSDKSGQELFRGSASGDGGHLSTYNSETGKLITIP